MNCGGADGQPPGIDLDNSSVDAASLMADMTGSPLEQAIGRENLERYEVALSELRQEEREAIIGRIEMGGIQLPGARRALGKPSADAARKATQRALIRLAEELRRARE